MGVLWASKNQPNGGFTLPPDMIGFYKSNIEYLSAHAVDPDKRRYVSESEAARHYIDIDHYAPADANPFDSMPRQWTAAVEKFSEDTLQKYGIVPWHINRLFYSLTEAFEEKDAAKVLWLSADIGHYIADAHVPLHTTENYNGQLSGQHGIHGLWESRIPELLAEDYDYLVGSAKYIEHVLTEIWQAVEESHAQLDSVLLIEKALSHQLPSDQKYVLDARGQSTTKQYSEMYAKTYSRRMGNMVEARMQKAIHLIGSIWYTAWVNAGQPALNEWGKNMHSRKQSQENVDLEKAYNQHKIKGRKHAP